MHTLDLADDMHTYLYNFPSLYMYMSLAVSSYDIANGVHICTL